MSLSWIPLPFPSCPSCNKSWMTCYHRDCYFNGEIVVEPYTREAKCEGCSERWPIMQTTFYCSCGHIFTAWDVENALSAVALLKERLVKQIQSMEMSESAINRSYQQSFNHWLYDLSYELGNLLGAVASSVLKWLRKLL